MEIQYQMGYFTVKITVSKAFSQSLSIDIKKYRISWEYQAITY